MVASTLPVGLCDKLWQIQGFVHVWWAVFVVDKHVHWCMQPDLIADQSGCRDGILLSRYTRLSVCLFFHLFVCRFNCLFPYLFFFLCVSACTHLTANRLRQTHANTAHKIFLQWTAVYSSAWRLNPVLRIFLRTEKYRPSFIYIKHAKSCLFFCYTILANYSSTISVFVRL